MRTPLRLAALAAALFIAVSGCSKSRGPDIVGFGNSPSTTSESPSSSASPAVEESAAPILADGRSPVYITSIDASHQKLTFDLVIFLTGQAAKDEWKAQGNTDDGPPNDYLIVNNNPKLRTLPVSPSVSVTYNDPNNSFAPTSITFAQLKGPFQYRPFWITVQNGTITKIEEQFIP
jgi:hypothetical protein